MTPPATPPEPACPKCAGSGYAGSPFDLAPHTACPWCGGFGTTPVAPPESPPAGTPAWEESLQAKADRVPRMPIEEALASADFTGLLDEDEAQWIASLPRDAQGFTRTQEEWDTLAAHARALEARLAENEEIALVRDAERVSLESSLALKERSGCPCTLVAPCSPRCTCADPESSGGCQRCALYGSPEQRQAAAERLVGLESSLATATRERDEARRAVVWALGYPIADEPFPEQGFRQGAYWWRERLRRISGCDNWAAFRAPGEPG